MIRFVLVIALVLLGFANARANAEPCPPGAVTPAFLDLSSGAGALCVPTRDQNGATYPSNRLLDCEVTLTSPSGFSPVIALGQNLVGERVDYTVPPELLGADDGEAIGVCLNQGVRGLARTVPAGFPDFAAPAAPVMLVR